MKKQLKGFSTLQILTHLGALTPLILLIWDFVTDNLTINPIQDVTLRTGKTALALLVLTLACTPIYTVFKFNPIIKLRRPLGLYAFMYIGLHFLTFIGLDYGFDPQLLKEAILEKRYALVGFSAFLLLIPLAITSTKGWMRRLGKNWKRLHKLVYLAVPLAIIHYVWLVKSDIREPLAFGAVVLVLLALRFRSIKKIVKDSIVRLKKRRVIPKPAPTPTSIPSSNQSQS